MWFLVLSICFKQRTYVCFIFRSLALFLSSSIFKFLTLVFYSFSDKFGSRWRPLSPFHSSSADREAWSSHHATRRGGKDQLQRGSSLHSFGWSATSVSGIFFIPHKWIMWIQLSRCHSGRPSRRHCGQRLWAAVVAAAASENSVQSTAAYDGQIALLPPLHQ